MYSDLAQLIWLWIPIFQNLGFEHLMKAYVRNQLITSVAISLAFFYGLSSLWLMNLSSVVDTALQIPWSQIHISFGAYVKAAVRITAVYAVLLAVNTRYISLLILPIIMLVFIGALFVIVSMKASQLYLKFDQDSDDEVKNAGKQVSPASEEDGNGDLSDKDDGLFLTVVTVLPCCLLFCTRYYKADNLVVSQFLLFLTSSLGELAVMMARLPSQVAPAFEAVHRASLVAVLLTAHTMAAELLGGDAVLICTPELVVALAWLAIHLGHGGAPTVNAVEAALRKADIAVLVIVAPILTYSVLIRDEPAGLTTNLLSTSYMKASVPCALFSVILPSLGVFVLRQWQGQATAASSSELEAAPSSSELEAAPSSELEAAIRLFSFCRDILLKAVAMFLVTKLLVDERLRSKLATDIWSKLLYDRT